MKKIIKIFLIFFVFLCFYNVRADGTDWSEYLSNGPFYEDQGTIYLDMPFKSFDDVINYNDSDYFKMDSGIGMFTEDYYQKAIINLVLQHNNYPGIGFSIEILTDNVSILEWNSSTSKNEVVAQFKLNFLSENDASTQKKVNSMINQLEDFYYELGYNAFNNIFEYDIYNFQNFKLDKWIMSFQDYKKIVEKNDDYIYEVYDLLGDGCPFYYQVTPIIGIFKDDVLYGIKQILFIQYHFLIVDQNASGSVIEKTQNMLNSFLNRSDLVLVRESTFKENLSDYERDYFSHYFNINITDINFDVFNVYSGDVFMTGVTVIEEPNYIMKKYYANSYDKNTGVKTKTNSKDVPLDSYLELEDVKDKDYVIEVKKNNKITLVKVYDIKMKKGNDDSYITNVEDGVDVYIPINGRGLGEKVKVYYIKDDSTIGETLEGIVVEEEGIKYVKFKTYHFSTFGIAEVGNPNTFDNILYYFAIIILSLSSICYLYRKNRKLI